MGGGYWNRLKKILIPYILWSVFYSVISSDDGLNPLRIVYHLITGKASAQLYYIIVLVELTLLTPLLMKTLDRRKLSIAILSITPCYLLLCCGYRYATGSELTWMGRDFCAWVIFYYFGMLIKRYGWKCRKSAYFLGTYLFALIISIMEGFIVNFKLGMFSMAIGQINVTTMIYSLTVIALIMNNRKDPCNQIANKIYPENKILLSKLKQTIMKMLVHIGDISFGIYFCHTFVLKGVRFVMRHLGFMEAFPLPLIQIMQFSLVLTGSIIVIYIFQRMDPKRKICPYLGF